MSMQPGAEVEDAALITVPGVSAKVRRSRRPVRFSWALGVASDRAMQVQTPRKQDVIRRVLAHHAEQAERHGSGRPRHPSPGYRPETLDVLFR